MLPASDIEKIIGPETTVFWLRRDLRFDDNAGLYYALKDKREVLPLFIFDTEILDRLEDKQDKRIQFIYQSLVLLKSEFEKAGSSLAILYGNPVEVFKKLKPKAIYCNHDYEPYAIARDKRVRENTEQTGGKFKSYKDQVIFEKNEILKDDGKPYTVFTPYSKKWKAKLNSFYLKSYPTINYVKNLKTVKPLPIPTLAEIGFEENTDPYPKRVIPTSIIEKYHEQRNFPAKASTTRLSVHLRFGTVSIRKLAQIALKKNETWLNELIWREFYQMILWYFPLVVDHAFKPAYDRIVWENNQEDFKKWCEGKTGYPIVDAGMRELNATGFMHNRVRMIVASFLTKHLMIDWRWGEAYFAKKLLDFELSSNNGGWQWAAGSGCDAAPYFRVFSPQLQTKKFDPNYEYIWNWVPEFGTKNYLEPMIDHGFARKRVLLAYKTALNS